MIGPARRVQIATPDSLVSHLHATSVLHACANDHAFSNDIDLHRFRVGPPRIHEAHSSASRPLSAAFTTASANALLSVGSCAPARAPGRSHRLIAAAMVADDPVGLPGPAAQRADPSPCDDAGSELDLPMCLIRS